MRYPSPHLIPIALIICIKLGEQYELRGPSLRNCLQPLVTSSLLEPNIFLSTLFSNTTILRCYLQERDQVLIPIKPTGKIIVLYILILIFLCTKQNTKHYAPNGNNNNLIIY